MLDEICPVQFVEGMNEGAERRGAESVVITGYECVGMLYVPSISYSLVRLETMLVFGQLREGAKIEIELRSDYDGRPSDIILSSGSFVPKTLYGEWRGVTLNPTSVLRNRRYWVTIRTDGSPTAFLAPKEGEDCELTALVGGSNKWETRDEDMTNRKVMLRFYGRVIPLSAI